MSGSSATPAVITVALEISDNPAATPGSVPFSVLVNPDLGLPPTLTNISGVGIVTVTLGSTESAPATYSGEITAVAAGNSSVGVMLDGNQIAVINTSVSLITESGTITLGTVVAPSLPPAAPTA